MKEIHLKDIYRMLGEAVRFYDNSDIQLRPNTFAVLENEKDLSNENMGKWTAEKNKPHFFSRSWEQAKYNPSKISWQYPAIVVYENDMDVEYAMDEIVKRRWSIDIHCLMPMWNECKNCPKVDSSKYKNFSELYNDAEDVLTNVMLYLNSICLATTSDNPTQALYNQNWLAWHDSQNPGFSYTMDQNKSHTARSVIRAANKEKKVFRKAFLPSLNAVSVFTNFNIPNTCHDAISWSFYSGHGVTPDK